LSYRVATRRQFLSLLNRRSIRLRHLYLARSCGTVAPVDLGRDHRLGACGLDFLADRIGIVSPISQEGLDPIGYHAEQRSEALHIVRLSGVSTKPSGRPLASHLAWSLVVKPPRDRPSASVC
jgi:hypothetical protein